MSHTRDGNYETGYGKPPQRARFRKGQSGNPRGRPRGAKNLATVMDEALGERVAITENGRRKTATKLQVIVKQMVNKAAQGDYRSTQLLMGFIEKQRLTGKDGKPLTVIELLNAIGPIDDENQ
jgi:Family of unknown function (DUF5681)